MITCLLLQRARRTARLRSSDRRQLLTCERMARAPVWLPEIDGAFRQLIISLCAD